MDKFDVSRALLSIGAVFLRPDEPFTWASGIKSPIYCDNRLILTAPEVRANVEAALADMIAREFPEAEALMGTATAGIAHAAIAANILGLPMGYVRSGNKDHGRQNRIEGKLVPGEKVVVVEDLISTGGSVLEAAAAVEREGGHVLGVLAIFSYELEKGHRAFEEAGLPLYTLSNYPALIETAAGSGLITAAQQEALATWSADPQAWSDAH